MIIATAGLRALLPLQLLLCRTPWFVCNTISDAHATFTLSLKNAIKLFLSELGWKDDPVGSVTGWEGVQLVKLGRGPSQIEHIFQALLVIASPVENGAEETNL